MRHALLLFLLFSAGTVVAQPVITSVTPNSGPVAGGTEVTIRGSGFSDPCAPPKACPVKGLNVYFGFGLAASSTLVDSQTVVAVTPPHLPESASVFVCQLDGCAYLKNAFTFVGDPSDAFERILLPIFLQPTAGAFGSLFVTSFDMWNTTDGPDIPVYGIPYICPPITCVPPDPRTPLPLSHSPNAGPPEPYGGTPGVMVFVPKGQSGSVAANLRVFDSTRVASTLGAEIPIARDRDFRDSITLLNIPVGSPYRTLMRIYSATPDETDVKVDVVGNSSFIVHLTAGSDLFHPATGTFNLFPPPPPDGSIAHQRVTIEPLVAGTRIWAFVSVTNNDTQQITVVSPQ